MKIEFGKMSTDIYLALSGLASRGLAIPTIENL